MPQTKLVPIMDLTLDLSNYRIVPQSDETNAVHALIAMKPKWFWALTESLINDGYLLTENIIVVRSGKAYIVKEGNRRVGAMKLLLGIIPVTGLNLPPEIEPYIAKMSKAWEVANTSVPCAIYESNEADVVDRIVSLAHAKGELAGRDNWNSVARARHGRDHNGEAELGLDLLESYLQHGKNISRESAEIWGGDYNLSVLDEALARIAKRLSFSTAKDFVKKYPAVVSIDKVDKILHDIGTGALGFPKLRGSSDFLVDYGLLEPPYSTGTPGTSGTGAGTASAGSTSSSTSSSGGGSSGKSGAGTGATGSSSNSSGSATKSKGRKAYGLDDPRAVRSILKGFSPRGKNREKVVTLRDELLQLKIPTNPIAFCFLLRSMFEISAKVYSTEEGLPTTRNTKNGPVDLSLKDLLVAASSHLIRASGDKDMQKKLQAASTELSQANRLLSVTSMNQLVHNAQFSVAPNDICRLFFNIFPLLEQLNA